MSNIFNTQYSNNITYKDIKSNKEFYLDTSVFFSEGLVNITITDDDDIYDRQYSYIFEDEKYNTDLLRLHKIFKNSFEKKKAKITQINYDYISLSIIFDNDDNEDNNDKKFLGKDSNIILTKINTDAEYIKEELEKTNYDYIKKEISKNNHVRIDNIDKDITNLENRITILENQNTNLGNRITILENYIILLSIGVFCYLQFNKKF